MADMRLLVAAVEAAEEKRGDLLAAFHVHPTRENRARVDAAGEEYDRALDALIDADDNERRGGTAMNREWQAWRDFCKEYELTTGRSVNEDEAEPMVAAVKLWGERLAELRAEQRGGDTPVRALNDAAQQYGLIRRVAANQL